MKRRDFIRTSTLGAVLAGSSGLIYSCGSRQSASSDSIDCFEPNDLIPVIADVDVFIAGGSTAGVSAALQIVRNGGSAFLVTDHPYLGEDICGTFNYWNTGTPKTSLAKRLFQNKTPQNPIFYKRILDEALLEQDIPFLFSSFVTDLFVDAKDQIAGVVISNRSGRQMIRTRAVIDATQYATIARIFKVPFQSFNPGEQSFKYRVTGNQQKDDLPVTRQNGNFSLKKEPVPVLEYTLNHTLHADTFGEYQKVEQAIRTQVWDADQMDSADDLFFIPPNPVIGKRSNSTNSINPETVDTASFQPAQTDNLYILNGYADISRPAAAELLKSCSMMVLAERIGKTALDSAKKVSSKEPLKLFDSGDFTAGGTKTRPSFDFIRPRHVMETTAALQRTMPVFGEYDVLVIGGGIAGAPAAMGAARQGAKTLVVEYLHGLGGMGTMGLIGAYFHGYRDGFTKEIDGAVERFGGSDHPRLKNKDGGWINDWKMEVFRSEILKAGGSIWFGAMGVGALVIGDTVEGVVIATPFGKGLVLAKKIVDSTGSADIAIAAGADYKHTDKDCLAVQGAGLPPQFADRNYNNTDWTFINDTDVYDVWRTFVAGKKKYDDGYYDIGKLPQTRERRRIVADHEISVLDLVNNRTYADTISIHKSSFDTHGFTMDPFFDLKPPRGANIDEIAYVPLRSLLPKGLENIIVTGLGAGANRDAMPVIRMQPCLQNQGYAVGHLAALAVRKNSSFRDLDIRPVQKKMIGIGSLPQTVLTDRDSFPPSLDQMRKAVQAVPKNLDQLEILLWDTKNGIRILKNAYEAAVDKKARLCYAHVLAAYGFDSGWKDLADAVQTITQWDEGWPYTGMGQFGACMSHLDSLIMALGRTRKNEALPVIIDKARSLNPDHVFSHFRAVSVALENYKHRDASKVLFLLLQLDGVRGHAVTSIGKAKEVTDTNWTNTEVRNLSLRELILARALYLTGDKNGLGEKILNEYAKDLKGHYARHAIDVLGLS